MYVHTVNATPKAINVCEMKKVLLPAIRQLQIDAPAQMLPKQVLIFTKVEQ
jgi:hypothetical protein